MSVQGRVWPPLNFKMGFWFQVIGRYFRLSSFEYLSIGL